MKRTISNHYIVKKVFHSFVLTAIFSSLTATLGMLVDNMIVGRFLGTYELGAMGVVSPVSLVLSTMGSICSHGGAAMVAHAIGKGERERVNNIFSVSLLFVIASGGLLTAAGLAFTPQIAALLGAEGELFAPSVAYLRGYFLSAIPTILTTALMSFVKIDGSAKLPLISVAVMTGANIILDLAMIFVFDLGMFGMALATTLSYVFAAATVCMHFVQKHCTLKLVRPRHVLREMGVMTVTGTPAAVSRICDTIKIAVLNNLLVAVVSAAAVTAMNIRTQANNLIGSLSMGVGRAMVPIVGLFFGQEDRNALQGTLKETLRLGFVLNGIAAVLLLIFPKAFAGLLGVQEGATMDAAVAALRLFAIGMPIQMFNTVMMNFYESSKNTGAATLICVTQSLVFPVAFAFLLASPMGSNGVWIALLLAEVFTAAAVFVLIVFKNRRIGFSLRDMMLLPDSFIEDGDQRLTISIGNSMDEVMAVSQGIVRFGERRNLDSSLVNKLSLTIEEIAGNVVQHAFRPGEKRWLDFVILDKPDVLVVRVRDNGAMFNPVQYLKEHPDDPKHPGIRIVHELADRFEYRYSLDMNSLMIEFHKKSTQSSICAESK